MFLDSLTMSAVFTLFFTFFHSPNRYTRRPFMIRYRPHRPLDPRWIEGHSTYLVYIVVLTSSSARRDRCQDLHLAMRRVMHIPDVPI